MPKYKVAIPVETTVYAEVEAESESAAIQTVDDNTSSYISDFSDDHDMFEFDNRGDIEISE